MLFDVAVSSWLALEILISGESIGVITYNSIISQIVPNFICDKLSAFFILVINFTVVTGFLYASGYLKAYIEKKPAVWIKLHYLALVMLHASMILVLLFRDGTKFLIVWELMTLSSFMLVIFDYDVKGTVKAAINYLVQMHIGMLFILGGLVMSSRGCGTLSFDNLSTWFENNPNWPVFMLFFIGFGLKAGFFFLHTWLPDAHPAAPSHVSGMMSGVMIKLGIYGILRVGSYLQGNLDGIGVTVIILSAITGLFGVMMAILQHDIKKLLAYHSIENIGIIGLGIGLGIYGRAINNDIVSAAGFAGALLHVLNHSLFKSLLFYSAGSVIQQVHTRNVEKMGGLIKFMPYTAGAFLIGALAISGLPPFNGFISEFLIYFSIFHGLADTSFYPLTLLFVSMISLVLIGGLALLCFTKVFGIVFLGQARSSYHHRPVEVSRSMLGSKIFTIIPMVLIGFLPLLAINPLLNIVNELFSIDTSAFKTDIILPFNYISAGALLLLGSIVILSLIRYFAFMKKSIASGPTWGCGYAAVNEKQQYTATSFVQEYATLIKPVIKTGVSKIKFSDDEIFPLKREFHSHSDDFIRSKLINRPVTYMVNILRKAAIFQTGKLQHYVLYALLFLVFIFLLTYLKLI
jgi:formate hydrogenlyase subunit 3/multisubunit Na+/H+ antiporter MnhD subunit